MMALAARLLARAGRRGGPPSARGAPRHALAAVGGGAPATPPEAPPRSVRAAVVGPPNAGKSALLNWLCGTKVSAVSPRTNTTWEERRGAALRGGVECVLVDTPGVVARSSIRDPGHGRRVGGAWAAASLCEAVLFVVDAERQLRDPDPRVERTLQAVAPGARGALQEAFSEIPFFLVLNKMDLLPPPPAVDFRLRELKEQLHGLRNFAGTFEVSAKRGWGCEELLGGLAARASDRQWEMGGQASEHSEATLAAEVVREKLFKRFNQELPYELEVRVMSCRPLKDASLRIEQNIYVPHNHVKRIVVGRGGAAIGEVGKRARLELQDILGTRVHLILNVKVRRRKNSQSAPDWDAPA